MPRILPERTVEAWTTAYVTRCHPTARLWAPTQNDPRRWDLSAAFPSGRTFVFEYKAVEGRPEPYVPIDQEQLAAYAALNLRLGETLVWYLLPSWDIDVAVGQLLPAEAEHRTLRADDPRTAWRAGLHRPRPLGVQRVPTRREEMGLARGCESFFYVVDPRKLQSDRRLHTFPGWGGRPGFPVRHVRSLAEGLTLEHFISLVEGGVLGVPPSRLADIQQPEQPVDTGSERLPPHHATAIAIEAAD